MFTKILLVLVISGSLFLSYPTIYKNLHEKTKIQTEQSVLEVSLPNKSELKSNDYLPKTKPASKTITLESENLVIFRGPVTDKSVAEVQTKILSLSYKLPKDTPIYLVLNTPGGSVGAGLDLIDFMRAIPQKVHTITLFAASMGFQIAQNMDTRYITPNGTLMSHRASLSGLSGQLDGELESRYSMIKRKVDYLDAIAAKRMELSVKIYKNMIINEYWVHGFDSVDEKAADEMVNVVCGQSLKGSHHQVFGTMFGDVVVEFSNCPLIQAPLSLSFTKVVSGKESELQQLFNYGFMDKKLYIERYINTGKHNHVFGI